MRETYREQLESVTSDLVIMAQIVRGAVRDSTRALLQADDAIAERVISGDEELDRMSEEVEHRCFSLLSLQAPVAGELRIVVSALRMAAELARMGDLAVHVAKVARLRYPDIAVPESLRGNFERMASISEQMVETAGRTLQSRDVEMAEQLQHNDEEMDDLRRSQFRLMLGDSWTHGVEAAVDCALLGRYYERISDHAVSMGARVVYLVTGEAPAGASHWP
ncbi:phosphate transport system regulatory protein PhoU [Desertihabitans brevis]|uniref:Phosphate-specific transport system accessory protein PhoU n=1 Tax=Desertihabitans brevis TaxID=2268447 RepID=A0A367YXQ6_9ACTN|nr:phosphate signaling complex protein PhoU [Desertihabitans brevis]RCK70676.1 phosphate transport system regulatory protein PhoU [Desertihabitans brevis]